MNNYVIKSRSLDPRATIPHEDRIQASNFERDGDLVIFYRGDQPVHAFHVDRVLSIERK